MEDFLFERQKDLIFDEDTARAIKGIDYKLQSGQSLDENDTKAILFAANRSVKFRNKSAAEIDALVKSANTLKSGIESIAPTIMEGMKKGQGMSIDRTQAPDLFNAFDQVYGDEINKGMDRTDSPSREKKVQRIFIGPDGQMVPELRVIDSQGKEYYAPVTAGRDGSPNAPLLTLPIGVFNAHLGSITKMGEWINSVRMTYGDKEFEKKMATHKENAEKSKAIGAGQMAVADLLSKDPGATVNKQRIAFTDGASKIGTLTPHETAEFAKTYIPEKETRSLTKYDIALAAANGDPGKALKLAEEKDKSPTEASLAERAAKGDKVAEKALDFISKTKKESKEPRALRDRRQVVAGEDGTLKIVDLDTGRASSVTDESGGVVRKLGKPSQFHKDQNKNIDSWKKGRMTRWAQDEKAEANEDNSRYILGQDYESRRKDFENQINQTTDRAKQLIEERNITSGEAINISQQEMGTSENAFKREKLMTDGADTLKRMLKGETKFLEKNWTKKEAVEEFRKKNWADADILELGRRAGVDLSEAVTGKLNGKQRKHIPQERSLNQDIGTSKPVQDAGTKPVLDQKTAKTYLKKVGWNGKTRATLDQMIKAGVLATQDGYELPE